MKRLISSAWLVVMIALTLAGCAPATPAPAAAQTTAPVVADTATVAPATPAPATAQPTAPVVADTATVAPTDTVAPASPIPPTPEAGGVFVRAMTSEPAEIDPQGAASSGLSLTLPYLFDTLVVRDSDNNLLPSLAEDWTVAPDGKTITMTLKPAITFHDGTPLNAKAVQFTFERFKETGSKSPIYGGITQISRVEAVDEQTVRFTFETPAANFWSTISMPYAAIISPDAAQAGDIVGSGPFTMGEWKAGESITLLRNADYAWGPALTENQGAPYLEQMVFKVIPDATTQVAALEAGEVHAIFINQPEHRQKLENNSSVYLEEAILNSLIYLGFNTTKAPFDDVRVRQALSHAVNKAQILELALGGLGIQAFAPLPPSLPGFDPSLESFELGLDPTRAAELLEEAGFTRTDGGTWQKDGQPLAATLLSSTRAPNDAIAALLQSQLKAIGVPVEIQLLDSKAVMQATSEGAFDLLLWRYDWNDPDALNIFLGSDRVGSTNRVGYSSPEVDELLAQGATELDEAARWQVYVEAQKLILTDAPWQPLYTPLDVLAIRTNVAGAKIGFMGRLLVNDARVTGE